VFAHARRGELFQHFTCLACGHRAVTWPTFRLHRRTCMAEVRIEP
jgi:transcription elongation factor Elf1